MSSKYSRPLGWWSLGGQLCFIGLLGASLLLGLLLLSVFAGRSSAGRSLVGWAVDVPGPVDGPAPGSFAEETLRETFIV